MDYKTKLWRMYQLFTRRILFSFSATNKVAASVIHKCRPFLGHLNLRGCYNLSSESIKLTGTAVYAWSNFFKIIFYVISNSASLLLWKEIFLFFLPSAQCRNLQDLNLSECSGVTVRTDNCNDYNDDNCYNKNCYQRHFFYHFNYLSLKSWHKVVQKVLFFQRKAEW